MKQLGFLQMLTVKLLCAIFSFGLLGMARGLDEGLISTTVAQPSFIHEFHPEDPGLSAAERANLLSNMTSMVHIGSLPGALFAFFLCEHIGMLWTMLIIVITATGSIGQVYAGHFFMGVGIGQAGVVVPVYLSEIAIPSLHGLLYFSTWGITKLISDSSSSQWIIPQSIQIIVAGIILFASLACEESPRYLFKAGRSADGTRALSRLWKPTPDDPRVRDGSIQNQMEAYAPELFSLLGGTGQSQKLLRTAILGAVKLAASLICTIFPIDYAGRKRPLIAGILIQFLAMLCLAIYFTVASPSNHTIHSKVEHGAGIVAIVCLYLIGGGWAIGWNSIQYLINAEIFPLSVRTVGCSVLMCFHYSNRYGLSKAVPSMLLENGLRPEGTFWFFAAVSVLGLLWVWVRLPETARRNLEEANTLIS
ncbi:major facilitator superfamily domain-containing protein [Aspergillus leporis]|uniref:Major facilitator superfamily domain-containing protein n=1 Tax=Aspergillus leporis TaxID=41062 RepID=A0A5N5XCT4_9EURO|nr:major facilitator superfamily domain-containing protein [Aspergillus leporis]